MGVGLSLVWFANKQNVLETAGNLRDIAATAKAEVARCDGRLISWDKPNERVVYYYGQNIPTANAVRKKFVADHEEAEGSRLWQQWLHDPSHPVILVERPETQKELDKILAPPPKGRGFVPITPLPKATDAKGTLDRRPILFRLSSAAETTAPAASPETPADRE